MARKLLNDDPTAWEKDINGRHKKKGLGLFDTDAWGRSKLLRSLKRKRKLRHFLEVKKQQRAQREKLNP